MCRKQPSEFVTAVRELTVNDITEVAQKILHTPLTMASHGNGEKTWEGFFRTEKEVSTMLGR